MHTLNKESINKLGATLQNRVLYRKERVHKFNLLQFTQDPDVQEAARRVAQKLENYDIYFEKGTTFPYADLIAACFEVSSNSDQVHPQDLADYLENQRQDTKRYIKQYMHELNNLFLPEERCAEIWIEVDVLRNKMQTYGLCYDEQTQLDFQLLQEKALTSLTDKQKEEFDLTEALNEKAVKEGQPRYAIGDKVVPIRKTVGELAVNTVWLGKIERGELDYLTVREVKPSFHPSVRFIYLCSGEGENGRQDLFDEGDLIPYEEIPKKLIMGSVGVTPAPVSTHTNYIYKHVAADIFDYLRNNEQHTREDLIVWKSLIGEDNHLYYLPTYLHDALNKITLELLIHLLYTDDFKIIDYEFKEGDWVKFTDEDDQAYIGQIETEWDKLYQMRYLNEDRKFVTIKLPKEETRLDLPTPNEIAFENERYYWNAMGRNVAQFKVGDVYVLMNNFICYVEDEAKIVHALNDYDEKKIVGIFPVERLHDLPTTWYLEV